MLEFQLPILILDPKSWRLFISSEAAPVVDVEDEKAKAEGGSCSRYKLPMTVETIKGQKYYNASFLMRVTNDEEEGLYNLYFHSCPNYRWETPVAIDFTVRIASHLFI